LLDLCRTGHPGFRLDCRPVELVGLVQGVVDRRRPLFEAARQWLWAETPDSPIWLSADRDQLERVLDNLLDNATKYTGTGGHVTVSVGREGPEAAVKVQDTGIGMLPEFVRRAFEPFSREDSSAVRARPGSGVGLLAVRRIVELHCGRTEAASRGRGLGSEFTVWLPITAEPAAADGTPSDVS
jgi:signal transduction histidine kinase